MPGTDELFGVDDSGQSLVSLHSPDGSPHRDVVLPVCYRNTPWALATAHALGIGVYREDGLLQHPDDPGLWGDIGYTAEHGSLTPGSRVTLRRSPESTPDYFGELLDPQDAVVWEWSDDQAAQDAWVAARIAENLATDELEHDDILIVLPDSYSAKSRGPQLRRALARHSIPAHLVGVDTTADEVFVHGSVAMAHIYRAKGNEAPMVYAVDCQKAAGAFNAVTRRSTLFTAITRSRAWVRIVGWGEAMAPVVDEVRSVVGNEYRLEFEIPTATQLAELRHIHRDRPPEHEASIRKATDGLDVFLQGVERGEVELTDLPTELVSRLSELSSEDDADG
jgi:superfamily I DNA and RNA helicase